MYEWGRDERRGNLKQIPSQPKQRPDLGLDPRTLGSRAEPKSRVRDLTY